MENAFVAPLAFQFELVAINEKVKGYKPNLLGKPKFENIWLEAGAWPREVRHGDRRPPVAGASGDRLVTFIVFALLKLVPGDIAVTLAGDNATDPRIAEIRKSTASTSASSCNMARGCSRPRKETCRVAVLQRGVPTSIGRAFPITLLIVVLALLIALIVGIPMGIVAAIKPRLGSTRS